MNALALKPSARTTIALGLLASVAAVGCTPQQRHTRGEVSTEPLVIDQAMQKRQWEPVTAYAENGSIHTWSTGFAYEPIPGIDGYNGSAYYFTDIGTWFVNVVTLPVTYVVEWDGISSGGVVLPPSYTANPPLPPSQYAAAEPTDTTPPPDTTPIDPSVTPATQP